MKNEEPKTYYVLSGEGEAGTWEKVVATEAAIRRTLANEKCGGDRWARAFELAGTDEDGQPFGHDVETGEPRTLPDDVPPRASRFKIRVTEKTSGNAFTETRPDEASAKAYADFVNAAGGSVVAKVVGQI